MSVGSEFHRTDDAATGKERRPTVVSRNGGTSSCCDDEERSRWRPCRSETRTSWFRQGGASACNYTKCHDSHLESPPVVVDMADASVTQRFQQPVTRTTARSGSIAAHSTVPSFIVRVTTSCRRTSIKSVMSNSHRPTRRNSTV